MLRFDGQLFLEALKTNALPPFGKGICAKHVRMALEAAGLDMRHRPVHARDYGRALELRGFLTVTGEPYEPLVGDIAVIQAARAGESGHIQGFDGQNWISDFVQREFWPGAKYRHSKPAFLIYRYPGNADA